MWASLSPNRREDRRSLHASTPKWQAHQGLRNCNGFAKARRFSEAPNLLVYVWIAEERGIRQITVPACHCQLNGKAANFGSTREAIPDSVTLIVSALRVTLH